MRLAQKTTLGNESKPPRLQNKKQGGWVSNTTDSGSDFTYAMPDSIADVLASQGFSEAARVFQSIGGDAVPQAMRAQLSMALPERTVTPDDVQQEIDEMQAWLRQRGQ